MVEQKRVCISEHYLKRVKLSEDDFNFYNMWVFRYSDETTETLTMRVKK